MPEMGTVAQAKQLDILTAVMKHFNKSIHTFAEQMHTLSIEASISCYFLFAALTIYLYRAAASSIHVGAAYRFLQNYEQQVELGNVLAGPTLEDTLIPILKRLFIDAATFSCALNNAGPVTPYEDGMYEILYIPQVFSTVKTAYETLGYLLRYAIALHLGHFSAGSKPHSYLLSSLTNFEAALHDSPLDAYDPSAYKLPPDRVGFYCMDLMMHHRVAQMLGKCTPGTMEHSFSTYTADFQYVLQKMSVLISTEPPYFWRATLCWIPPLFLIATRCRVTKLRREALKLLHGLRRVERGWTSCIAYALATFVVNEEETPEAADPTSPSLTYIRLLSAQFEPHKALVLITYEKQTGQKRLGVSIKKMGLHFPAYPLVAASGVQLPDYILRASGYSGTTMVTPPIACHCSRGTDSLSQAGEAVVKGSIEETVIWGTGRRTIRRAERRGKQPDSCEEHNNVSV